MKSKSGRALSEYAIPCPKKGIVADVMDCMFCGHAGFIGEPDLPYTIPDHLRVECFGNMQTAFPKI